MTTPHTPGPWINGWGKVTDSDGKAICMVIHRKNGETVEVPVTCRLDSDEEVSIYEAGGVLQRFAQDFLASAKAA